MHAKYLLLLTNTRGTEDKVTCCEITLVCVAARELLKDIAKPANRECVVFGTSHIVNCLPQREEVIGL